MTSSSYSTRGAGNYLRYIFKGEWNSNNNKQRCCFLWKTIEGAGCSFLSYFSFSLHIMVGSLKFWVIRVVCDMHPVSLIKTLHHSHVSSSPESIFGLTSFGCRDYEYWWAGVIVLASDHWPPRLPLLIHTPIRQRHLEGVLGGRNNVQTSISESEDSSWQVVSAITNVRKDYYFWFL